MTARIIMTHDAIKQMTEQYFAIYAEHKEKIAQANVKWQYYYREYWLDHMQFPRGIYSRLRTSDPFGENVKSVKLLLAAAELAVNKQIEIDAETANTLNIMNGDPAITAEVMQAHVYYINTEIVKLKELIEIEKNRPKLPQPPEEPFAKQPLLTEPVKAARWQNYAFFLPFVAAAICFVLIAILKGMK